MLDVKDITKIYHNPNKEVKALDGVSLNVGPGEFVTVEGSSGSGKSTLLFAAGSLLAPDEGQILIDSQNPYALSFNERAKFRAETIGFVFQMFHLVPYLTVLENVMLAAGNGNHKSSEKEALTLYKHQG